jgi:transcriptional regulator with XRE-family HTH domain
MDAHLQRQICARIKLARVEAGYTQDEMASLLNMTMRGYQNYESTRVPFRHLEKIADLTNVSQMWLLRGDLPGADAMPPLNGNDAVVARIESLEGVVESLRQALLALHPELAPSSPQAVRQEHPAKQA